MGRLLAHRDGMVKWLRCSDIGPDGVQTFWHIDLAPLDLDDMIIEIAIPTTWQSAPCSGS